MAFGFVNGATSAGTAYNVTASVAKPTNTAENDLLVFCVGYYVHTDTAPPTTIPEGVTQLAAAMCADNYIGFVVYSKVAGGSEPASYTFSFADGNYKKIGISVAAYRDGFDTADAVDATSNTVYSTNDAILRGATVDYQAGATVLHVGGCYRTAGATTFTPETDWTEDYDAGEDTSDFYMQFSRYTFVSSGSSGSIDVDISATVNKLKHAFLVALNPPAAAPSATPIFLYRPHIIPSLSGGF